MKMLGNALEKFETEDAAQNAIYGEIKQLVSVFEVIEAPKIDLSSGASVVKGLQDITNKALDIVNEQLKSINIQDGFLFKKVDLVSTANKAVSTVLEMVQKGFRVQ